MSDGRPIQYVCRCVSPSAVSVSIASVQYNIIIMTATRHVYVVMTHTRMYATLSGANMLWLLPQPVDSDCLVVGRLFARSSGTVPRRGVLVPSPSPSPTLMTLSHCVTVAAATAAAATTAKNKGNKKTTTVTSLSSASYRSAPELSDIMPKNKKSDWTEISDDCETSVDQHFVIL